MNDWWAWLETLDFLFVQNFKNIIFLELMLCIGIYLVPKFEVFFWNILTFVYSFSCLWMKVIWGHTLPLQRCSQGISVSHALSLIYYQMCACLSEIFSTKKNILTYCIVNGALVNLCLFFNVFSHYVCLLNSFKHNTSSLGQF